ncbi:hypothetical protein VKT23_019539 [Stygiomarasmius scandens]|uniref:Uncharacterized protein n=1 Tax=Marasmiellus scandens TaxID=2682957 RepID=A0ABR1IL72_9AGAR
MQFKSIFRPFFALAVLSLFAGNVAAVADNDVDACNGKNNYDVGHECAFNTPGGVKEGTCQKNACNNLVCVPN